MQKEEIDFFKLADLDVWMALQHLVKPGRAAPHRTDPHKRRETFVEVTAVARQSVFSVSKFQDTISRHDELQTPGMNLVRLETARLVLL